MPHVFGNIILLSYLILFYRSKNNPLWFALIIFLTSNAGYLFSIKNLNYALPTLTIPGSSKYLLYNELFILTTIVKAYKGKYKNYRYFLSAPFKLLFSYMIFLTLLSFVYGVSIIKLLNIMRQILPLGLLYYMPKLLATKEDYYKLFSLLFTLVIVMFSFQLYDLFTGSKVAFLFGETQIAVSNTYMYADDIVDVASEVNRIIYGSNILLISFIGALYFAINKDRDNKFKRYYLYTIIGIILISVLLSATRGWILSVSLMMILFALKSFKKNIKVIAGIAIPLIILANISIISLQAGKSFTRLSSLKSLIAGDITANGTLIRLDVRGERVLRKIYESPIFGYGFSNTYNDFRDYHVGHHTMLLNGGIIGLIIFLYFSIFFIVSVYKRYRSLSVSNPFKLGLYVFIVGYLGMFIIHSTSVSIFRYEVGFQAGMLLVLFFSFSDMIYKEAGQEQIKRQKKIV